MGQTRTQSGVVKRAAFDLERVGRAVGGTASAATIFGQAVEQGGTMIVPVARAIWGYGGGEDGEDGGHGAGGGAMVRPLGYIEVRDGKARFRRIGVRWLAVGQVALAGVVAAFLLRHLTKGQRP